jgi:hypothetical protein
MPSTDALTELLQRAITTVGERKVADTLEKLGAAPPSHSVELTIIANSGMHSIPEEFIHGEKYVVSHGNLDLSSLESIESSYTLALRSLADKLRQRTWKNIFLIPTGPTTLTLQIKLLVYHVTRLSTIDLHYSQGKYFELDLNYRSYLASEGLGSSDENAAQPGAAGDAPPAARP